MRKLPDFNLDPQWIELKKQMGIDTLENTVVSQEKIIRRQENELHNYRQGEMKRYNSLPNKIYRLIKSIRKA